MTKIQLGKFENVSEGKWERRPLDDLRVIIKTKSPKFE